MRLSALLLCLPFVLAPLASGAQDETASEPPPDVETLMVLGSPLDSGETLRVDPALPGSHRKAWPCSPHWRLCLGCHYGLSAATATGIPALGPLAPRAATPIGDTARRRQAYWKASS